MNSSEVLCECLLMARTRLEVDAPRLDDVLIVDFLVLEEFVVA